MTHPIAGCNASDAPGRATRPAELADAQKRMRHRVVGLLDRIAELYRSQKNSFLSLRTSGDALTAALARAEKAEAELREFRNAAADEMKVLGERAEKAEAERDIAVVVKARAELQDEVCDRPGQTPV
jgi:hypothetical protein